MVKPAITTFLAAAGRVGKTKKQLRNLLSPWHELGGRTGTATLLICHTNKRKLASGRDRIADSSDLWDIARSVMMVGFTGEEETRYLSRKEPTNPSIK